MEKHIIRCKCGHLDYEDHAYWLRGGPWCRNCYMEKYEEEYGKKYPYEDLFDVELPSERMYNKQELYGY